MAVSSADRPSENLTPSSSAKALQRYDVTRTFADSQERALAKAKGEFVKDNFDIEDTKEKMPPTLRHLASYSFVARLDDKAVAVTLLDWKESARKKHWGPIVEKIRSELLTSSSSVTVQVRRVYPQKTSKFLAVLGAIMISVLAAKAGLLFSSESAPEPVYLVAAPPTEVNPIHPQPHAGTLTATGGQPPSPASSEMAADEPAPLAQSTKSIAEGSQNDIQQNLEKYLNSILGPYLKPHKYSNVRLQLTQPLFYSPGDGTAACTIDGSIESDQQTLLPSQPYQGEFSGAGSKTELIEAACHEALNQMVSNYKLLSP